jgi:hypothetical protein
MSTKTKTDKETTADEEAVEQEFLQKQVGEAEQQNVYEFQMSSTETALVSPEDYRKLKLSW